MDFEFKGIRVPQKVLPSGTLSWTVNLADFSFSRNCYTVQFDGHNQISWTQLGAYIFHICHTALKSAQFR